MHFCLSAIILKLSSHSVQFPCFVWGHSKTIHNPSVINSSQNRSVSTLPYLHPVTTTSDWDLNCFSMKRFKPNLPSIASLQTTHGAVTVLSTGWGAGLMRQGSGCSALQNVGWSALSRHVSLTSASSRSPSTAWCAFLLWCSWSPGD